MKALICDRYGGPENLRLADIERPQAKEGEVLVRVHAASLNSADWRMLVADPFLVRFMGGGFLKPKQRPGIDLSGVVEALGPGAKRFKVGDAVVADLFNYERGCFAEYACAPETVFYIKPPALSFEEASCLPLAGVTALTAVRDAGRVKPGMKVLINGASGGVGVYALQIAKYFGAEVTAVCASDKFDQARSLGADRLIDYRVQDFSRLPERYDLILGVNGNASLAAYKRALKPGGSYFMVGGGNRQLFQAMLLSRLASIGGNKKLGYVESQPNPARLETLCRIAGEGKLRSIIDRTYSLEEAQEAYTAFGKGHLRGKIVIKI